jgi:NAD+ synthase
VNIAIAQLNAIVGDVAANVEKIGRAHAASSACDLVVFSELVLIGYPPEDLVLRPAILDAARSAIDHLAPVTAAGPALLVGTPWKDGGAVYNAVVLLEGGRVDAVRYKHELPNYGVFDEQRVFVAGPLPDPIDFRGIRLGVPICEDMWYPRVAAHLKAASAEMLLVPNGSPFERGKMDTRITLAAERVRDTGLPLMYVNQVGGQDELVFDGGSFVIDADQRVAVRLPFWREATCTTVWTRTDRGWTLAQSGAERTPDPPVQTYEALMIGLRDYVEKNNFPGVLLGMSGGIDSALTAAVAVDALGADRVLGVRLPSRFTSPGSLDDAEDCASRLGMRQVTLPIEDVVAAVSRALAPLFGDRAPDVTEENVQARVRGLLLMALSNKFGSMLLTTGNKSEMSVGYATLYGDMCGGYSVLKDLYKTEVYELARWRNGAVPDGGRGPSAEVIPEPILTKAPTAELRPNQTDRDTLPDYEMLDAILRGLVEHERSVDELAAAGFARAEVSRIQNMLYAAEYKRRQAPPGVKTSSRNFGRDRRYPITNRFRER